MRTVIVATARLVLHVQCQARLLVSIALLALADVADEDRQMPMMKEHSGKLKLVLADAS